jgi:signal transduction histidine kinase
VREMVAAGARGYILKGDSPSAILEALSVSVRGGARLSAEVAGPVMQDLRTLYEQAINRSKQLEVENETLTQEVAHLEEVDRLKDEFLAMVSHELRSPITVLLGMASTLSNRPELAATADGHEMLTRMVRQGVRLRDMVEQILQASAFAADRSPALHNEQVAVVDLIREIITDRLAADAEHPIVLHAPEQPRPVTGDPKALHAVVSNLIDNAAKHAPAGTTIEVMVSQPLGWTRIGVADRGPGVAVEDRQRIFGAFTQVDGSTTRRVSGVGLGLFLVDKFVRGMGGRVWVDEARGGGALFMVEIPDAEVRVEEERQESWPDRGMYTAGAWG